MHSSSLYFSASPLTCKALFEIVCDELGFFFTDRSGYGKIEIVGGDDAAFGRVCYSIVSTLAISDIVSAAKSGTSDNVNYNDMIDVIKHYLYTVQFMNDLENLPRLSLDNDKTYSSRQRERDLIVVEGILDNYGIAQTQVFSPTVEKIFRSVYVKSSQLHGGVSIIMMYSRVSFMRLGIRRSASGKTKAGATHNNHRMFQDTPDLAVSLENDFWEWLRADKMTIQSDRDDTVVMSRVMGHYIANYFLPYWFKNKMPKYVNNRRGVVVGGKALMQVDLIVMPVAHYADIDVHAMMKRMFMVSNLMFKHQRHVNLGSTTPHQYTILEYYVEKRLQSVMAKVNSGFIDVVKGAKHTIAENPIIRKKVQSTFELSTDYSAGRIVNAGSGTDASFGKRIRMNKKLVALIDNARYHMDFTNIIEQYSSLATKSMDSASTGNSNTPYIPWDCMSGKGLGDKAFERISDVIQCLCDLDNLDSALKRFGMSIIDLFSMRYLNEVVFENLTTVESLVQIILAQANMHASSFSDGVKEDGTLRGYTFNELKEFMTELTKPNNTLGVGALPQFKAPTIRTSVVQGKELPPLENVLNALSNISILKPQPDILRYLAVLRQLTTDKCSLTCSELQYDIDVTPCRVMLDEGEGLDIKAIDTYYKDRLPRILGDMEMLLGSTSKNIFYRIIGAFYVVGRYPEAFASVWGRLTLDNLHQIRYLQSAVDSCITNSKFTRVTAADVGRAYSDVGDSPLLARAQDLEIKEMKSDRITLLRTELNKAKATEINVVMTYIQRDDHPAIMFDVLGDAIFELGRFGCQRYLQDKLKNTDTVPETYYMPVSLKDYNSEDPADVMNYFFMSEPNKDAGRVEFTVADITESLSPRTVKACVQGKVTHNWLEETVFAEGGEFQSILLSATLMYLAVDSHALSILKKIFGEDMGGITGKYHEYQYILNSYNSKLDLIMTHSVVVAQIHNQINANIADIVKDIEHCEALYAASKDRKLSKDQTYYTEIKIRILYLQKRLEKHMDFENRLKGTIRYMGTGMLSNVLDQLGQLGIAGYVNIRYRGVYENPEYLNMQTDIILATIQWVIDVECAPLRKLNKCISDNFQALKADVDNETALHSIRLLTASASEDLYPIYRELLIKATQTEEFAQQSISMPSDVKSVTAFKSFMQDKDIDEDNFVVLSNGRHYYNPFVQDSYVFVYRNGIMLVATLATGKVDFKPFSDGIAY